MGTDAISPGTADRRQAVLLTVLASEAAAAARTSEELDVGAPSPEDIQILEYLRVQHEEVECVIRPAGYYRSLISKVRAEAAAQDPQAWANELAAARRDISEISVGAQDVEYQQESFNWTDTAPAAAPVDDEQPENESVDTIELQVQVVCCPDAPPLLSHPLP